MKLCEHRDERTCIYAMKRHRGRIHQNCLRVDVEVKTEQKISARQTDVGRREEEEGMPEKELGSGV